MVDYRRTRHQVSTSRRSRPAGPIAGAGTSTAALIGTRRHRRQRATSACRWPSTNWTSYTNRFGGYSSALPLPYAVRGFFENGGTLAYVVAVKDWTRPGRRPRPAHPGA